MKKMKHLRDYATTVTNSKSRNSGGRGGDSTKSLHPKIFCKKKKRMIKEIREDCKKL